MSLPDYKDMARALAQLVAERKEKKKIEDELKKKLKKYMGANKIPEIVDEESGAVVKYFEEERNEIDRDLIMGELGVTGDEFKTRFMKPKTVKKMTAKFK